MRRLAAAVVLVAISLATGSASAQGAPDPGQVKAAAERFDAGVVAFRKKDFESAADHFEAADAAVPSARTLRLAIRARAEAGQGSRAATLAELALGRYRADRSTIKLARDTIEKFRPLLFKATLRCPSPCSVAIGALTFPGGSATRRVVYLDPGAFTVRPTFDGEPGAPREVTATAGGSAEISLEPDKKAEPEPPKVDEPKPRPPETPPKSEPSKSETPPDEPKPDPPPDRKGISPAFFAVSLAGTVGVGAAMIWSGVDTQNNPGAAAVQAACQGKGPSCPLYQEGLSKQTRTNALIGGTVGGAALTVILAVFTNWHRSTAPAPTGTTAWMTVSPILERGVPGATSSLGGASAGVAGVF